MIEVDLILTLSLVTFGLVSLWMYQSKLEAEAGLAKKRIQKRRQPVSTSRSN